MEIKTLSLHQPWASLIAGGHKQIETRSWSTVYRGKLAIHAAKKWDRGLSSLCGAEPFSTCLEEAGYPLGRDIPLGAVVAVVDLVKVYQFGVDIPPGHLIRSVRGEGEKYLEEWHFGDYTIGRYGWVLDNIKPLPEPIPVRGRQGLWTWQAPAGVLS